MKIIKSSLITLVIAFSFSFGFGEKEISTFTNSSKSIEVSVLGKWNAAANMKGIEIYLYREAVNQSPDILTISSIKGLKEGMTLDEFCGSKISLQLSVLGAQIQSFEEITVNNLPAKKFVYKYTNSKMENITSIMVFTLKDGIGYQITASAPSETFEMHVPVFLEYINSVKFLK